MKTEQIEKAARDYALDQLGIVGLPGRAEAMKAFISGAQWRINSVWHDANEIPLHESRIFYEDTNGIVDVMHFFDGDQWDGFDDYGFEIARWAYVSDLLPERKERNG